MRFYNGITGLRLKRQVVSLLAIVFVAVAATVYSSAAYAGSIPAGAERHLYVSSLPKVTWVTTMVAPFGKSLGATAGAILPQSNVITDARGDKWTETGSMTTVSNNGLAMLDFSPGSSLQTSISGGSSVTATAAMSIAGPTAPCLIKLVESDYTSVLKLVSNNGTLALVTRQEGGAPTTVMLPYTIHTNQRYAFTITMAPATGHSRVTVMVNNNTLPPVTVQLGKHFVASMDRLILGGPANSVPVYVSEAAFYQTSVDVASLTGAEIVRDNITLPADAPAATSSSGGTPANTSSGGSTASAGGASSAGSTSGAQGATGSSGSGSGSSSGSSSGSTSSGSSSGSSSSSGGSSSGGSSSSGSGSSIGSSGSTGGTGGSSGASGGSSGSGGSTGGTGGGSGSGGSAGSSGSAGGTGGTGGAAGSGGSSGAGGTAGSGGNNGSGGSGGSAGSGGAGGSAGSGGAGGGSGSGGSGGTPGAAIICDDNSQNNYLNGQSNPTACYNTTTGTWSGNSNNAWGAELSYSTTPGATFAWTTNQVQSGSQYSVQISVAIWGPAVPSANNVLCQIYDGGTLVATIPLNQQASQTQTVTYNGVPFITLTQLVPTTNTLTVKLTNQGSGALFADAIRIAPPGSPPSATFTDNPSSVTAGASNATVSFSNQQSGVAPYTYSYDFGNTGTFEIAGSSSPTAVIPASYLTPNITFPVRGRIMDSAGDYTDYLVYLTVGAQGWITTPYLNNPGIPDFAVNPACTNGSTPIISVQSGSWSNGATWSGGQVPGPGAVVQIAAGTIVTYDVNDNSELIPLATVEVESGGTLTFSTAVTTQMYVVNLIVLQGGTLNIGTQANPIPVGITANVVWVNQPLNTAACDPQQFGNGLIGLGTINTYGAVMTPHAKLAQEAHAGNTTLTLASVPTGWQAGNKLELPDSHQWSTFALQGGQPPEWEQAVIQAVSPNANNTYTVTLTAPLAYDHFGPHDANGNVIVDPVTGRPLMPDAVNMTRNVAMRSKLATGVRGYALFTAKANVDIEYTAFTGMGRSNNSAFVVNGAPTYTLPLFDNTTFDANGNVTHVGTDEGNRNAITFLNLIGPSTPQNNGFTQPGTNPPAGYQFTFNGNVVTCPLTPMNFAWGINVVNSYYGLIQDNDVVNWYGSGIMIDGVSSYNRFNNNVVMRINGTGGRGNADMGMGGDGFWDGSANNHFTNNIVSDILNGGASYGYGYEIYELNGASGAGGDIRNIAAYQGADPSQPGQFVSLNMSLLPILDFTNNEAYGNMPYGFSFWWTHYNNGYLAGSGGTIEHPVGWSTYGSAIYGYQESNITYHNFVAAGDYAQQFQSGGNGGTYVFSWQDYDIEGVTIDGLYGFNVSTSTPVSTGGQPVIYENSTITNGQINISPVWSVGGDQRGQSPTNISINNCKFISAGQSMPAITMSWDQPAQWCNGQINITAPVNVLVTNYNGVPGYNARLEYYQQAENFLVPPSRWIGQYEPVVGAQDASGNPLGTLNPNNFADTTGGPGGTPWVTNQYLVSIGSNPVNGLLGPFTATVNWDLGTNNWDISGFTALNNSGAVDGTTLSPPIYGVVVPCTASGC